MRAEMTHSRNKRPSIGIGAAIAAMLLALWLPVGATTISLNITDGAGEGLNDPTPAAPTAGNTGTTIGEQRQIAANYAARMIETIVSSSVPIVIDAAFDPLSCSASSGTLGSAGPNTTHRNFGGAPLANTYYVQAHANSLAGSDLSGSNDIGMTFNSDVDNNNNCLNNRNWYYGLDGNASGQDIDFFTTAMHEILHGIGFLSLVTASTGQKHFGNNDAYMVNLEDDDLGETWGQAQMTDTERMLSATDDPNLHWIGAQVQAEIGTLTAGTNNNHVRMHAPSTLAPGSSVSHFSTTLSPNQLMEPTFTGAEATIGLARAVLVDIGWQTPASSAPIVAALDDQILQSDTPAVIDVAILDNDTAIAALTVTATSSNPSVITNAGLVSSGSGRLRQLTITPVSASNGSSTITVTVSDGTHNAVALFNADVFTDLPPTLNILSPTDGSTLLSAPQIFQASALDNEDGDISAAITWQSSIDGALGSSAMPSLTLSDGAHLMTASVTDSGSNFVQDSITINVSLTGDEDGDGLANALEVALGTDPYDADTDDDYLNDFDEVNRDGDPSNYTPGVDTDPFDPDTDDDGLQDGLDLDPLVFTNEENVPLLPLTLMFVLATGMIGIAARRRHG